MGTSKSRGRRTGGSPGGPQRSTLDLLYDLMKETAEKAARAKKGNPEAEVTLTEEAAAVGVKLGTYHRCVVKRKGIPREGTFNGFPEDVARRLLRLRKLAVDQSRQPSRKGATGTAPPAAAGRSTIPAQARPYRPIVSEEVGDRRASGRPAEGAPPDLTQPDGPAERACDPDERGGKTPPPQEGGQGVTIDATGHIEDETQHSRDEDQPRQQKAASDSPSPSPSRSLSSRLTAAQEQLADAVFDQCDEIASDPRYDLLLPLPLPLRWRLADDEMDQEQSDRAVENALAGHHGRRFDPFPKVDEVSASNVQAGGLAELFALHSGLPSGRLVVTGRYGSGKSSAAILTMLEVLEHRRGLPAEQRAEVPVPVRLSATTWNPRGQSLRAWFADQLATTYEFLTSNAYGADAPRELIRHGCVSLFLEGLDQMTRGPRRQALMHLAAEHSLRVVVTTRPQEYAEAAAAVPLPGGLVVRLEPVPTQDAVDYLRRRQDGPGSEDTGALIEHLIQPIPQQPETPDSPESLGSPVSQALDSPLFLTLLRADPAANAPLLTAGRFQTRRQVEDFLLARVVPRAYGSDRPHDLTEQESQQWDERIAAQQHGLELVAAWMAGTDLAWWQIHQWAVGRWGWVGGLSRCLANALAGVLVMGGLGMLVFGPVGQYTVNDHTGVRFGLLYGMGMGGGFGLLAGVISETRDLCRRRSTTAAPFNPAIAGLILAIVTLAVGNQSGYPVPLGHLLFGLPAGLIAATTAGYAASLPRLTSLGRSPRAAWRPSRADLPVALAPLTIGVPIGITYELTKSLRFGVLAGLFTAFTFGLMISVARPLSDPGTSATPFTRWRQDRRRALRVGIATGTPMGLALGFQNGLAHGPLAGVTAALGLGTIIALGCMAGVSDSWRTTLAFAQLHLHTRWSRHRHQRRHQQQDRHEARVFPLAGMRFFQEACDRDVMRTSGPYLQFRHARLQELLASAPSTTDEPTQPEAEREEKPAPQSL